MSLRKEQKKMDAPANGSNFAPTEFEETFIVRKPLGLRIHKTSGRVTYVESSSVLTGRVFVGDRLVAIDGRSFANTQELNALLSAAHSTVAVRIRHAFFSHCKYEGATVERLQIEREVFKTTGRAIELFTISLKIPHGLEESRDVLKWGIRYDARERVQVAAVEAEGLAAVHLKAGDIIREVNGNPIASKTMLRHWLWDAVERGELVRLSIERSVGGEDTLRDQVDTPADVLEIAQRQIQKMKQKGATVARPAIRKGRSQSSGRVKIDDKPKEEEIRSDHDVSTLKKCKNSKG